MRAGLPVSRLVDWGNGYGGMNTSSPTTAEGSGGGGSEQS